MFELTDEQRQELNAPEPTALDPHTQQAYVLVRREVYERMKSVLEGTLDIRDTYPLIDAMAAKEGWGDPAMDIYNDFAKEA